MVCSYDDNVTFWLIMTEEERKKKEHFQSYKISVKFLKVSLERGRPTD